MPSWRILQEVPQNDPPCSSSSPAARPALADAAGTVRVPRPPGYTVGQSGSVPGPASITLPQPLPEDLTRRCRRRSTLGDVASGGRSDEDDDDDAEVDDEKEEEDGDTRRQQSRLPLWSILLLLLLK